MSCSRIASLALVVAFSFLNSTSLRAADPAPVRVGILGIDNYQGSEYARFFNSPKAEGDLGGVRVTAIYPVTSDDYPRSAELTADWMKQLAGMGKPENKSLAAYHPFETVDSIEALLTKCDAVLMAGLDGRKHLDQATKVLKAGKRLVIVRPLASNSADAHAILQLAHDLKVPCFSSSQHRFSEGFIGMRNHPEVGKPMGCDVYGGYDLNAVEADKPVRPLHSLETLYTIMGPGVETVSCVSTPLVESYTLTWSDGRVGTYRGIKQGAVKWSATVFGDTGVSVSGIYGHGVPVKGIVPTQDKYTGYEGFARAMGPFFRGGPAPVSANETMEIYAVIDAADKSKANGGAPVKIKDVMKPVK